jgi:hypothetical protein
MHGHLPRIFCNHRMVVAPNIRVVTVPGVKTASSRRKSPHCNRSETAGGIRHACFARGLLPMSEP